jgi:hypothetical protein
MFEKKMPLCKKKSLTFFVFKNSLFEICTMKKHIDQEEMTKRFPPAMYS